VIINWQKSLSFSMLPERIAQACDVTRARDAEPALGGQTGG